MARLAQLEQSLGKLFRAPAPKKLEPNRRQREDATKLAELHGIEIEKLRGGGMNVWAPTAIADTPLDPFSGDHFAGDWEEALGMVKAYAELLPAKVNQSRESV